MNVQLRRLIVCSSRKESMKPVIADTAAGGADDGWEQVAKKDKRKKDSVVEAASSGHRGRGGQRGGGGDRGRGRGDTLPRKNSSKPPRGGVRDRCVRRYCSTMLILSSKNVTFECELRVFGELKLKDSGRM